jgi:hypothetical protein
VKKGYHNMLSWDNDPVALAINRALEKYNKKAFVCWDGSVRINSTNGERYYPQALQKMADLGYNGGGQEWLRTPRRFSFRMKVK